MVCRFLSGEEIGRYALISCPLNRMAGQETARQVKKLQGESENCKGRSENCNK
jgi:hypothetical protein